MTYVFQGDGGINKVFLGAGVVRFAIRYTIYNSDLADTLIKYHETAKYKRKNLVNNYCQNYQLVQPKLFIWNHKSSY